MRILKISSSFSLFVASLFFAILCVIVNAGKPIRSLSVSLKGKQYDVNDVTTVKELRNKVQAISGIDTTEQGNILFGTSTLDKDDIILSDVGIENGSKVIILPKLGTSGMPTKEEMEEYLQQAGISKEKLEEMLKGMGGDGTMPSLEDSMKAMTDVMNSPMFTEMMNDPEKLEQSRQMIINNPMLKSMMSSMPGMEELLNNPDMWREAMQSAANMFKNMDPNQLLNSMMMGAESSLGSMGLDMFSNGLPTLDNKASGSSSSSSAAKALAELDEDD